MGGTLFTGKGRSDSMTGPEIALRIWEVLIEAAHNRQTLTYEMLADLIGGGMKAWMLAPHLWRVSNYCTQKGLPPLTVLVVGKHTGRPSTDLISQDPDRDRERVFNQPWFQFGPLQVSDFEGVPASGSPVKGA